VIIDRHTFIDLASHLEGASEGILEVTKRCVALCEDGSGARPPTQSAWIALVESLVSVNVVLPELNEPAKLVTSESRITTASATSTIATTCFHNSGFRLNETCRLGGGVSFLRRVIGLQA